MEFAESGHPTLRATTPLSRGILKSKGRGKLSIHFAADEHTIDTIFRIILSVNQLSVYGAVAAICEEFESHQDGSGEPEILMGQSIVLGEVKAEDPLQNENPMNDQIIWQQYIQQVESLSLENKVSKFCKEAGFMRVVEVGQYFVTKDTGSLRQFRSVACREYTLPRDDPASQAKGWIQGNMRIGPVLEVTTSFQHFKYGIEIRIWSVNQDNSQSWVRISYGTIKYVVDSIQDNTEILADPQEERVPQTNIKVVAARSKAKAKPQPRVLIGTTAIIPMHERRWIVNQILPTLFTLRDDESRIIAVMSSDVDDLLYGYLPEGAEAMNSVLQQFLVGKEEHGTFRFCGKEFRQNEDFGIHVAAKENTERAQPITCYAKHGLTRKDTADEIHQSRSVTQSLAGIARQTRLDLSYRISKIQSTLENSCVRDLRECNRVVEYATSTSTRGIYFLQIVLGMMRLLQR